MTLSLNPYFNGIYFLIGKIEPVKKTWLSKVLILILMEYTF